MNFLMIKIDKNEYFDTSITPDKNIVTQISLKMIDIVDTIIENDIKNITSYANIKITNKLRQEILKSISSGNRVAKENLLSDVITKLTKNISEYIMLHIGDVWISNYHIIKYQEVDIKNYKWSFMQNKYCNHDHLKDRIFDFNNPPIVDSQTQERANPGQQLSSRCICVAIPIIE